MNKIAGFSSRHIQLIRRLINLASEYGHDKELFYRKFIDAMSPASLMSHDVIELEEKVLAPAEREEYENANLTKTEIQMCSLEKQGFLPREMAIMYGVKDITTIYVRKHRINKKLKGACEPEVLLVSIGLLLIVLLFMRIFGLG